MARGSILDIFYLGGFALGLVFISFLIYYFMSQTVSTAYPALVKSGFNETQVAILNQTVVAAGNFVTIVPVVVGATGIIITVAAAYTGASVFLLAFGILLFLVAVLFFSQLQAFMPSILGTSVFASLSAQFPYTAAIGLNIGWIILGFGALVVIVSYARFKSVSQSGLPEG